MQRSVRRSALIAVLGATLVACQPATGAFAFITVDVDPAVADRLAFPKTYIIELGSRTGELQVTVEGLGQDGKVLVRGLAAPVAIRPGEQLSLAVRLKQTCAANAYCKTVPGEEALHLVSSDPDSWTGSAVAAAPLAGGAADDLIIGARTKSEVYVVFNDPLPTGTFSLQTGGPDVYVHMQCPPACGDGICEAPGETAGTCPADCAATCTEDGSCGAGETCGSCPADCGPCELTAAACAGSGLGSSLVTAALGDGPEPELVIGAASADAVYVLHGPFTGSAGSTLDVKLGDRTQSAIPYTLIKGPEGSSFGYSLAVGDLMGPGGVPDGKPDLVVGAQLYDPDAGRDNAGAVFVIPNDMLRGGVVDLGAATDGVAVVLGATAKEYAGGAVAVGDVIGGTDADLVVGAYKASPSVSGAARAEAGVVHLVAGPLTPGVWDLATTPATLTIVGPAANAHLGVGVAAGDFTGDGNGDLVLGAPGGAAVYLIAGPVPAGSTRDLADAASYTSLVHNGGDAFGSVVGLADVTGDDVVDVMVGAPSAVDVGRLLVLTWGAGLPADLDFDGRPTEVAGAEIVITGGSPGGKLGSSVAAVDPVVGASGARELLVGAVKDAEVFYVTRAQ